MVGGTVRITVASDRPSWLLVPRSPLRLASLQLEMEPL
jgi:hypothetical protein